MAAWIPMQPLSITLIHDAALERRAQAIDGMMTGPSCLVIAHHSGQFGPDTGGAQRQEETGEDARLGLGEGRTLLIVCIQEG